MSGKEQPYHSFHGPKKLEENTDSPNKWVNNTDKHPGFLWEVPLRWFGWQTLQTATCYLFQRYPSNRKGHKMPPVLEYHSFDGLSPWLESLNMETCNKQHTTRPNALPQTSPSKPFFLSPTEAFWPFPEQTPGHLN